MLSILILSLFGCKDSSTEPSFTTETVSKTLSGDDVYFIFTNTSMTNNAPVAASVSSSSSVSRFSAGNEVYIPAREDSKDESGIMAEIREFNESGFSGNHDISRNSVTPSAPNYTVSVPSGDVAGTTTGTFFTGISDTSTEINATCQFVDTIDGIHLSIWVANADWGAGVGKVDQTMVDDMADKFLLDGSDDGNTDIIADDIYAWVTNIYGVPWGTEADKYTNLLGSTEAQNITILLYDIDNDSSSGSTIGFFYSKDNFQSSEYSGSNERIMFYIDAYKYAVGDSDTIFSTLAHEFQHMIHFYQKQIMHLASGTDTWINEMCSEVTEDFLADKLNVSGPRGFGNDLSEGTAPYPGVCRLNNFNVGTDESFLEWSNPYDYAAAYAFGAFLARNYGGTELFQKIVQSSESDEYAVLNAVNNLNSTSKTFEDLLIEWGVAVLNSELTDTDYKYNKSGSIGFPSSLSGTDYYLGAIDLNNYETQLGVGWNYSGPIIYNDGEIGDPISGVIMEPGTNTFYQAGDNLTGTHSWTVEVPRDVTLTAVVKDSL